MIRTESIDDIRVVHMERGHGNALSPAFLSDIQEEIRALRSDPPRGVVLTGRDAIFCAGLDLGELLDLDREAMRGVLHLLYGVCRELFAFPRPVVAALNGHAIAGGAILALACDGRWMAQGQSKFGLSEISLGVSVPPSLIEMIRYSLDRPILEKLLYGGTVYPAFKAYDMGVLDALVEPDTLIESSIDAIERWSPSLDAFADIKSRLKAPTLDAMASAHLEDESWLTLWFSKETKSRLSAALAEIMGGGQSES